MASLSHFSFDLDPIEFPSLSDVLGPARDYFRFEVIESIDVAESLVLEVDSVSTVPRNHAELKLNILLWMGAGLFVLILSGFGFMVSAMNDNREELQNAINGKASEGLIIELQRELRADRKAITEQFEKIRSDMRQDRAESVNRHLEIMNRLPPATPKQ